MSLPLDPSRSIRVETRTVDHLSFLRHIIDKLGIYEVLAELLPKDPRSTVSDADCCVAMMLNILSGRVALYRMADWCSGWDTDALFGCDASASAFTDDRLGRALDHLHQFGTDELLSAVVAEWFRGHDHGHAWNVRLDASTLKLFGAYEEGLTGHDVDVPVPARGFSKDRRPDLKQLVYGLSMVAGSGTPLASTMHDGNTSDKVVNAFHITQLASCLPPEDEITFVADSKLMDKETLGHLLDEEFHFLSRLPRTFGLHAQLVDRLMGADQLAMWVGEMPGNREDPSPRPVLGASFEEPMDVVNPRDGCTHSVTMRFLVVRSPRLVQQMETTLPRAVEKDRARFTRALAKASKRQFDCEADARSVAEELRGGSRFHDAAIDVREVERPLKRKRGRPRKDAPVLTKTVYVITTSVPEAADERIERRRFHGCHFILATDHVDRNGWTDADLYRTYREQYEIEGHMGFRWLKGPAAVAPMFLKLPHRMNALGLIFVLSMMVRNYVQWEVRAYLEKTGQEVPYYGDKKPTRTPTAEVIWNLFIGVRSTVVHVDEQRHQVIEGLSDAATLVIQIFGLRAADLVAPRHHGVCWLPGQ